MGEGGTRPGHHLGGVGAMPQSPIPTLPVLLNCTFAGAWAMSVTECKAFWEL